MNYKLLLILTFCTITFSYSQEWKLINSFEDKETYMKLHSDNSAWLKVTNQEVQIDYDKTTIGTAIVLYKFDCRDLKMGMMAFINYDSEGEVLSSKQIPDILVEMEYPFPDTVGEFYLKTFCDLD